MITWGTATDYSKPVYYDGDWWACAEVIKEQSCGVLYNVPMSPSKGTRTCYSLDKCQQLYTPCQACDISKVRFPQIPCYACNGTGKVLFHASIGVLEEITRLLKVKEPIPIGWDEEASEAHWAPSAPHEAALYNQAQARIEILTKNQK